VLRTYTWPVLFHSLSQLSSSYPQCLCGIHAKSLGASDPFACPLCHSLTNAQVTRDPKLINHQHDLAVDALTCPPLLFPFLIFFCRNTPESSVFTRLSFS
jgi:hypothetical protein